MDNLVLNLVASYKRTAAFLAALELGLFGYLQRKAYDIDSLAKALQADKSMLELLLCYLASEGLVKQEEGLWENTPQFADYFNNIDSYTDIVAHEKRLAKKWVTSESIMSSVLKGVGGRDFDHKGFEQYEKDTYFKAMSGKNMDVISFWIQRELMAKKKISYLEFGRSAGAVSLSLMKRFQDMDITLAIDKDFLEIYNSQLKEKFSTTIPQICELGCYDFYGKFDLICIYNTIHYYPKNEAVRVLSNLKNTMSKQSLICIADIFLNKDDRFNVSLLLDWITHGGIYNLNVNEIGNIMAEAGLRLCKQKSIPGISTDLIFGSIL